MNQSAENTTAERKRTSAFDLVASQPWAVQPEMLETIAAIARREGEGVDAVEAKLGRPLQNTRKVSMRGSVAVVPITGPIFRYANLMTEISGATSLEVLARDITAALDDPNVSALVLDINSPGGQATGIADVASMIHSAGKPVVAFVELAASAAYWLGAAAGEVVISKTGLAGSIGAVLGLDVRKDPNHMEIVSSQSPNKRPDATTDAGRAQMQTMVDALAQVFIDDVATFRGRTSDQVISEFGAGAVMVGDAAVSVGMADRIGTIEEVIAGLAGKQQAKPATLLNHPKGSVMHTVAELKAAHPDLCAALVEEGRTAGLTAGAEAERNRIMAVESQALPGHADLIARLKYDGNTTGPEAAVQVLNAERAKNSARADAISADAPKPVANATAPQDRPLPENDPSLSNDERIKAKWESSADLQAEFGGIFAAFAAFEKANGAGKVRVLAGSK